MILQILDYLSWTLKVFTFGFLIVVFLRYKIVLGEFMFWVPFRERRRHLWGVVAVIIPLLELLSLRMRWNFPSDVFWEIYGDMVVSRIVWTVILLLGFLLSLYDGQIRREGILSGWLYPWEQLDYYTIDAESSEDFYELTIHTRRRKWFSSKMRVIKWKFGEQAGLKRVTAVLEERGVHQEREVSV